MEHGLAVAAAGQRPVPFDMPKHGSCSYLERGSKAGVISVEEAKQGFIVEKPKGLVDRC